MSIWHKITGWTWNRDSATENEAGADVAFTIALVVLGAGMARADGTISRVEIATFRRVFRLTASDMDMAGRLFDQACQDKVDYRRYARQAGQQFRKQPHLLEQMLDGLFAMAYADHHLHDQELAYLRDVAGLLGISDADFARIHARHRPERSPYAVLGVERNASETAIRLAHRRLSQDLNPDRLIAAGMPRELVQVTHDKVAAVDAAFATVCRDRGFAA